MGLFSFFSKNKQESTAEDSGYYSGADEQALNARARSKRASSAGEPAAPGRAAKGGADDPVLPEKKRARRRLVGAIGLALAVAIGLPMILDSEPKPLASDIEIRIPSKAQAVTINGTAGASAQGTIQAAVPAASAALGPSEQIIATPPVLPSIVMPATDVKPEPAPMPLPTPTPRTEAPVRPVESRIESHSEAKPVPESKPASKALDSTRALAILEGRVAVKEVAVKESGGFNYVVQVAALATQDKVDELQARLKAAGIDSYTQKISTPAGQRIRIRVGPFASREEADKALARLARLGLNGSLVPT